MLADHQHSCSSFLGCSCASQCGGRKKGELNQAIGRSRGGRTTKIHALTDGMCRSSAFLLTGGTFSDCKAGEVLINRMPATSLLNADKGYDSDAIRRQVRQRGAFANIPPKANRTWKNCFSPHLYRDRNAIERMFCRLKDFRRIATRYDRLATNFLAAVCGNRQLLVMKSGPSDWGGLKRPLNSARRINQITTIQKIEIGTCSRKSPQGIVRTPKSVADATTSPNA